MKYIGKEGKDIGIILTQDEYDLIAFFIGNCIADRQSDSIIQDTLMDTYKAFIPHVSEGLRFRIKPTKENGTVLSFNRI